MAGLSPYVDPYGNPQSIGNGNPTGDDARLQDWEKQQAAGGSNPFANQLYQQSLSQNQGQAYDQKAQLLSSNYGGSMGAGQAEMGRLGGIAGQYQNGAMGDWAQGQGSRGSQQDALGLMQQAAYGNAPSVAAIQQQQGLNEALRNQTAMAGGARGAAGIAGAQYNAAQNTGAMQQQGIGNASMLRAQEMAAARGAYGQMSTGIRGQDIQSAMGQGQMGLGYEGLGQNIGMANLAAQQRERALEKQQWAQQAGLDQASNQMTDKTLTGLVGTAGGIAAAGMTGGASLAVPAAMGAAGGLSPRGAPGGTGGAPGSSGDPSQYGYY